MKSVSTLLLTLTFTSLVVAQAAVFASINGVYNGLFFETNGYWQQSSGSINITTTSRGRYTARLQIGPKRYSFSGQFDADGRVDRQVLRYYDNPLTVRFQVDSDDPDLIVGSVSDGTWTSDLFADRAVFNGRSSISPDTGQYTMAILGDFTSTNNPGGISVGTMAVDKAGRVRFAATMADGTRFTQATTISKNGQWPLYGPLYRGNGSLYSWIQINGSPDEDLSGDVTWIKPEMSRSWFYPEGFAIVETAIGSRYSRPPRGNKVLDLSSASIEFNGGNRDQGITNHVTLHSNNLVQNLSANGLRLSISIANGSFSGRVMDPITWEWLPFRGVVLQRQGIGAGYFLNWNKTGEVWLQSE